MHSFSHLYKLQLATLKMLLKLAGKQIWFDDDDDDFACVTCTYVDM